MRVIKNLSDHSLSLSPIEIQMDKQSPNPHHPPGESVFTLDLYARNNERNCEVHFCCGRDVLWLDSIIRLQTIQVRV